ncbi:MAG: hypothetical protein EOL95_00765 [Bacteroidia bacterium]|nr:hypothetical protein [Bacteroidia bacterium]
MKKILLVIVLIFGCVSAYPQAIVTDPTSMSQRIALFFEQMEEALSQRMQLVEQVETAQQTLQISKEAREKLKKVSSFIQASADVLEIANSSIRITKKIGLYKNAIIEMDHLTTEEKYNILCVTVKLGHHASEKVSEGIGMSKTREKDGEFSDYERLQMLKTVKEEVLYIESEIDDMYSKCLSQSAYNDFAEGISELTVDAMMFASYAKNKD